MKANKFIASLLFFSCSLAVAGYGYRPITNVANNGMLYINMDDIQTTEARLKFWQLIDYSQMQSEFFGQYISIKAQIEADCEKRQYRNIQYSWHDEKMGQGGVVLSMKSPDSWRPIKPNTVMAIPLEMACLGYVVRTGGRNP